MASDLYELLRRCHRVELLALAKTIGVREQDLGLAQLATRLDQVLRQMGGHALTNLVRRGGDGPPWHDIVGRLCRRADVPVSDDVVAMERALLSHWVAHTWSSLSEQQKTRAWDELGLARPMPEDGNAFVEATRTSRLPTAFALSTVTRYGPLLAVPFLGPLGPLAAVLYLGRPDNDRLLPAVLEVARLRQLSLHRVTVGVVGSPSCGKDAAIKAVFDIDSGNIDPVAGSTSTVDITRLPGASALYVVNTPGLGDVIEAVTAEARQVLDLVDVYVYVVNAQGGVQQREKADYDDVVSRGRPVLAVINKIDTLLQDDRARYLADARVKLGAPQDAFLAAAFDPIPALSPEPIGVDAVRQWLLDRLLALGKDPNELGVLSGESAGRSAS